MSVACVVNLQFNYRLSEEISYETRSKIPENCECVIREMFKHFLLKENGQFANDL